MVKRYPLSKKERRKLWEELSYMGDFSISDEALVEYYQDENGERILVNGEAAFFKLGDKWIPHLRFVLKNLDALSLPRILVDKGAMQALLRGADLMAPGIKAIEGAFREGDIVVICELESRKPFAIGRALAPSDPITKGELRRGKVVENIHYFNDEFWRHGP
ncbi:MAG: DUF1947 domain-containing protein [Thermosphaera sp.]